MLVVKRKNQMRIGMKRKLGRKAIGAQCPECPLLLAGGDLGERSRWVGRSVSESMVD